MLYVDVRTLSPRSADAGSPVYAGHFRAVPVFRQPPGEFYRGIRLGSCGKISGPARTETLAKRPLAVSDYRGN